MYRDFKFAVCHTNTAIKKSTEFRNMDLDNALRLVPPKEPIYNENRELVIPKSSHIKILKSRTICGDYHSIPIGISPERETSGEKAKSDCFQRQKTNLNGSCHKKNDIIRNNQINTKIYFRNLDKSSLESDDS
jgi:hypothetical protein